MKFIIQDLDVWADSHKVIPFLIVFAAIIWVVSIFIRHPGVAWGALARICASLTSAAVVMVLIWQTVGGWFPPAATFLCVTGLIIGVVWAAIYVNRRCKLSRQLPDPSNDSS